MDLILASQSPRRRDLLTQFGVDFSVQILAAEEIEVGEPLSVAEINAVAKAVPVSNDNPDALVLGADTIVVLDGEILGKPADLVQAEQMLRRLSGREHSVTTAVALATGDKLSGSSVRPQPCVSAIWMRGRSEPISPQANPWTRLVLTAFKVLAAYLWKALKVVIIMLWDCPCRS